MLQGIPGIVMGTSYIESETTESERAPLPGDGDTAPVASSGLRPVSASDWEQPGARWLGIITMLSVFAAFTFIPYQP